MTYFETPTAAAAYFAGVSVETIEAREDAIVADMERMDALGRPDIDPEDRDLIPEHLVSIVSEQDRADLITARDWEAFEGFGS